MLAARCSPRSPAPHGEIYALIQMSTMITIHLHHCESYEWVHRWSSRQIDGFMCEHCAIREKLIFVPRQHTNNSWHWKRMFQFRTTRDVSIWNAMTEDVLRTLFVDSGRQSPLSVLSYTRVPATWLALITGLKGTFFHRSVFRFE